jgi:hypothetical protein
MLDESVELNKALQVFIEASESLEALNGPKICDISEDIRIHAAVKFLKIYELFVRIDEILIDVIRHKRTKELEESLERTKEMLSEITSNIKSLSTNEKGIMLAYLSKEFTMHQRELSDILKKRPAERIWTENNILTVVEELDHTLGLLRKAAAMAIIMSLSPEEGEDYLHKIC